jgi:predicted small metal-binding protein
MSYEVYCKDAGAASCRGHVKADSEDDFKSKLLTHLREKHGVVTPNDTVVDYLMSLASTAREESKSRSS